MAIIPSIIAAGQLVNAGMQQRQNKKSREWSEKMYARQKQDNLDFWAMQNNYNSPQEQMKRLQEAGLNPNLIYGGSGGVGNSSSNIGSVDTPRPEFNVPEWGSAAMAFPQIYDLQRTQAQTDNLKAQTQVAQETALFKQVQTLGEKSTNVSKAVKARLDESLFDISLESARQHLNKLKADTQFTLDQNERASLMFSPNFINAVEDILSKRAGRQVTMQQLKNMQLQQPVLELDAKLAKMGMRPTDPFYWKIAGQLLGFLGNKLGIDSVDEAPKGIKNTLDSIPTSKGMLDEIRGRFDDWIKSWPKQKPIFK